MKKILGLAILVVISFLTFFVVKKASAAIIISEVAHVNVTANDAFITWTTDELSTSQVEYGTSSSLSSSRSTAINNALITSHSVLLTGLTANTTYYYRAKSSASGFTAVSSINSFKTLVATNTAPTGQCQTKIIFDIKPNPAGFNQEVTFSGTISFEGSVLQPPDTANAGYCLNDKGSPVKVFYVSSENSQFGYVNSKDITVEPNKLGPYPFTTTVKPIDRGLKAGQTFDFVAVAYSRSGGRELVRSSTVKLTLTQGVYGTYACVATDGKYACSPGSYSNCSDVGKTEGRTKEDVCGANPCIKIPDSRLCGQVAPTQTHKECQNKTCLVVPGAGADTCATDANCVAAPGGGTTTQKFELENPIGVNNFQDLINIIGKWIFNLAIPIAVIIIIYAGVIMLTAGGNPANFQKGAKALWYAVIGLAVVLIGKGFVTLIQSILSLRK